MHVEALNDRNIHVWPLHTDASDAVVARLEDILAPDERDRAARFLFNHLRRSYVLTRGALRILLGHNLRVSAASIQFEYGSKGKPFLPPPATIGFNTSHSGELAV